MEFQFDNEHDQLIYEGNLLKKVTYTMYVLLWSDFLEEKTLATQQVVQNCVRTPIPKFYSFVVF